MWRHRYADNHEMTRTLRTCLVCLTFSITNIISPHIGGLKTRHKRSSTTWAPVPEGLAHSPSLLTTMWAWPLHQLRPLFRRVRRDVTPPPPGAGQHWPPSGGRQRRCEYGRGRCVIASIGCSFSGVGFCCKTIIPDSEEHLLATSGG